MTKKEVIGNIRDTVSGVTGATVYIFGKKNGKWFGEWLANKPYLPHWSGCEWVNYVQHKANSCTWKEAKELLEDLEWEAKQKKLY